MKKESANTIILKKNEIKEILRLGYEIATDTKKCVFVRYSGHVNLVEIEVFEESPISYTHRGESNKLVYINFFSHHESLEFIKSQTKILRDFLHASRVGEKNE